MSESPSTLLRSRDEEGASAVEYGLLAAGVAGIVFLIIFSFGGVVQNLFSESCSKVSTSVSVGGSCS